MNCHDLLPETEQADFLGGGKNVQKLYAGVALREF